jgi:3-hydroxyisobutyrate dehydrogenase-like beta-hydroxyacid dehydrogenase
MRRSETIAFIGAGNMGRPMIGHLVAGGYRVVVSVRRPEMKATVAAIGAEAATSPAEAARGAAFILTNVTSTQDVEEALFGPVGAAHAARRGAVCIDFSTISPLATRNFATRLEEMGLHFLDAPVSGGTRGAEAATLSIMVGGREETVARARPLFDLLGKVVTHVGDNGAGQAAKACNQIVQVVNIEGIAEAMRFCGALGVDPARVLTAISAGMAGSKMLDLMGPKMVARDFAAGIEARLHAKDFGLVHDVAAATGLDLPATEQVLRQLQKLLDHGWGNDDTSSLLRVLEAVPADRRSC